MKKIAFIVSPTVELLNLASPVQVFTKAKFYGFDIGIEFCCLSHCTIILCTAGATGMAAR